ncbi:mechanosensitive ion channel family protein [Tepidibacillus fermentans]|uniref:Small conductance mechanosensitive channel n=1 Tax=Tepidibacillus fermentans TaxID=1281767 RepID=A0A4R3KC58_9BACI|nr:mechanosensitive ion channel family protein [Tepidibacillus fermentans]TCS80804.1 small conductance mechanosensitive channel [Tepidibacillus fermentans]
MNLETALENMNQLSTLSFWESLRLKLMNAELWMGLFWNIVQILFIIVVAKALVRLINTVIDRWMNRSPKALRVNERRAKTVGSLIHNAVKYTINFIAILMVLEQLGFNLGPVLAGAGVLGLAIGFGAQNLVKDVISGFFIIFEDQFGVGDQVSISNFSGVVEEIGLRITKLRSWTGELHIIPNGTIKEVTNYSTHNSVAVVDIGIAYEENLEHVTKVLEDILSEIFKESQDIVKPPEILGVQNLGPSEVVLRIIAETKPMSHYAVARKLRAKIKEGFDREGIEIPYPKMVTFHRNEESKGV